MKKDKKLKQKTKRRKRIKIIIIFVVLAIIIGAVTAGLLAAKENKSEAYVQPVSFLNPGSWVFEMSGDSGTITESAQQSIYLEELQSVAKVYVKEGDSVKKGDKLFEYDSTIADLEYRQAVLSQESAESQIKLAKQLLAKYEAIKVTEKKNDGFGFNFKPSTSQALPKPVKDEATGALKYNCTTETLVSGSDINGWIEQGIVAVLSVVKDGKEISSWEIDGKNFLPVDDGRFFTVATKQEYIPEIPDEPYIEEYTQVEKDRLIAEQELEIKNLENSLAIANTALEAVKKAKNDLTVTATMDGTVTVIGDAAAPPKDGTPFCRLVGKKGTLLKSYIDENELLTVKVGDKITVTSYMTGTTAEAEIVEIDKYPSEMQYYYGRPNMSHYKYTAYIEKSDGFEVGEDVSVTMGSGMEEAIALERCYVRTDENGTYAMVDDGNGRLTRREVKVKDIDNGGSRNDYIAILDGLEEDDLLAFPYGVGGVEGARTTTERSLFEEILY